MTKRVITKGPAIASAEIAPSATRRMLLRASVSLGALKLAACGANEGEVQVALETSPPSGGGTGTPVPAPAPSPTPAPAPTPPPAPAPPPPPPPTTQTVLRSAVESMAVNEWRLFKSGGWPTNYFSGQGSNSDGVLSYVHSGVRDPYRMKLFYCGAGYGPLWFCTYDEVTGTWSRASYSNEIHAWDHTAYDVVRGIFYYGSQGGGEQRQISVDSMRGSSAVAPWASLIDTYGMEFWPSLDSTFFADRSGTLYRRTYGGSTSTFVSRGPSLGYHQFLTHNPVRNVMYWGGGNGTETVFREVSSSGVITTLPNSPGIDITRQKALCGDQTGDLVVFNFSAGTVSRYRHGSGWSSVSTSWPSNLTETQARSMAIPLHGLGSREVFMLFRMTGNSEAVCYLYRYS
jgi:hypothetical protein